LEHCEAENSQISTKHDKFNSSRVIVIIYVSKNKLNSGF
jgi:hypothetical protein